MLDAHAAAILTALRTSVFTILDGQVKTGQALPYVVASFRFSTPDLAGQPDLSDLTYAQTALGIEVTTHSAATTATGARIVQDGIRSAMLGATLIVVGRSLFPIRHADSQDPRRDEETEATIFDAVDVWSTISIPG